MINGEVGRTDQAIEFNNNPEISNRIMQAKRYLYEADRYEQQAKMQKEINQINYSEKLNLESRRRKITAELMAISLKNCGVEIDLGSLANKESDEGDEYLTAVG